jgi:hypothetical protein
VLLQRGHIASGDASEVHSKDISASIKSQSTIVEADTTSSLQRSDHFGDSRRITEPLDAWEKNIIVDSTNGSDASSGTSGQPNGTAQATNTTNTTKATNVTSDEKVAAVNATSDANATNNTNGTNGIGTNASDCVTKDDALAMGSLTIPKSPSGTACVFGMDPRDEGEHCISESGYGTYGWCYTSKDKSSWGSCSETCPPPGYLGVIAKEVKKLRADLMKIVNNSEGSVSAGSNSSITKAKVVPSVGNVSAVQEEVVSVKDAKENDDTSFINYMARVMATSQYTQATKL